MKANYTGLVRRRRVGPKRSRGMTVLIVLLLIAVTLGLSYAVVRSQTTAARIQQNANLRLSARQAAIVGMGIALNEMNTSRWCDGDGVDTVLNGVLSEYDGYQVTYATGDLSLEDPDSIEAIEYACRVTLLSTGSATDPSDPGRTTTHTVQVVVQLAPRAIHTEEEPVGWARITEDFRRFPRNAVLDWTYPREVTKYFLYPGGKEYSVDVLVDDTLRDVTLAPDRERNPAGIYFRNEKLRLDHRVTITGTIITGSGDVNLEGAEVRLEPYDLLPLNDRPIRLPTIMAQDDFNIQDYAQGTVTGLVVCWNKFKFNSWQVSVKGSIIAKDITALLWYPRPEEPWPQYNWKCEHNTIYVPGEHDDGGLRWEVVKWTDNP